MISLYYKYITFCVFGFLFIYTLFNISIIVGWFRLSKQTLIKQAKIQNLKFSILIPMRNESDNILNILKDIENQLYNNENYEIIIIDDHSSDNSFRLVEQLNICNLILLKNIGEGKKSAIKTGSMIAKNSFIIQSDADCRIKERWLSSINQYLNNHNVKLLVAPVIFASKSNLFSSLQELDFYALIMNTAGLIGIKYPIMANAANLIYPKDILSKFDITNSKTSSGDDIFLLHYIKKEYGEKNIHFLKSKDATIKTMPTKSIKEFIHQRFRWASKNKYYKDGGSIKIGLFIFLIYFLLLVLFGVSLFSENIKQLFIIVFILKILIDTIVLIPILSFYKKLSLLIYFPILSFLYPFYISFVGIFSSFIHFKWKNRLY